MVALPMVALDSRSHDNSFPNSTAMAGHTMGGAYCECYEPGCICEAVATPPAPIRPKLNPTEVPGQPDSLDPAPESDSDLGIGMLLGALLLALLLRIMN
jgi:hypothetical protein